MKLRPFELGLVTTFGLLAIVALIMMNGYKPAPDEKKALEERLGSVTIWGTIDEEAVNSVIKELSQVSKAYSKVEYKHFLPEEFDYQLLRAMADKEGPDLILVSHEKLVEMRQRIRPTSYDYFPVPDVRKRYVDGAEIFALADGLYGYPIAVDPLMMYWNRDILTTEGYLKAPSTWETLVNTMFPDLIKRNFDRSITRSVVAMGEYDNVRNGFGVISTLLIQGGSTMVIENKSNYKIMLNIAAKEDVDPLHNAVDFYTRFGKSDNTLYSWNRSFNDDRLQFVSENLAFYFGYGSEATGIARQNPNLNFDIAEVPQGGADTVRRTYGKIYALSMLDSTDNGYGASVVLYHMGSAEVADKIAIRSGMAPADRTSLAAGSNDIYGRDIFTSAAIARGWLNPDLPAADDAFERMVEDLNENRVRIQEATTDVSDRLRLAY